MFITYSLIANCHHNYHLSDPTQRDEIEFEVVTKQNTVKASVWKKFIDKEAVCIGEAATQETNQVLMLGSANDIHFIVNLVCISFSSDV